jgi:MGT family glycosyltransferase
VYFTLGTIFNLESGDLFTRVLTGLRELPIEVVVTVGRNVDTDEVGPQPVNVHIERFIPQSMVLPYCDLVVSHGGSGSVVGALAHGLPQVVLPMGADQPLNAARIEALGVGRTLDARRATSEMVRSTVESLFAHPGYASAAQRVQSEIDALPGPESTVARLERM